MIALVCLGFAGCGPVSEESPVLVVVNGQPITQSEFIGWAELSQTTQARYRSRGKHKFLTT
jgi:hypothetical protein